MLNDDGTTSLSTEEVDAQMNDHISKVVGGAGDVVPAVAARELVSMLAASNPSLLTSWLDLHAEDFLQSLIRTRIRAGRSRTRKQSKVRKFSEGAQKFTEDGDGQAFLSSFDVRYAVDDNGSQRRVAEMTGSDHKYVASRYEVSARTARMLAAFHREVAKHLGEKRVADVFTEEQYALMYRSIVGADPLD